MPQLTCFDLLDKVSLVRVKGVPMKRYINISWREQPYQPLATKLFVEFTAEFYKNLGIGECYD